jgi:hypothetical protein
MLAAGLPIGPVASALTRVGSTISSTASNPAVSPPAIGAPRTRGVFMIAPVSPVPPVVIPSARADPVAASRRTIRTPPMWVPMNLASRLWARTITWVGSAWAAEARAAMAVARRIDFMRLFRRR